MATRIRFARGGSKKKPFYRLVVADKRSPRDGNFIEKLGTYNPLINKDNESRFVFNKERVEYWLGTGATPSEKVAIFLYNSGFKKLASYLPAKYPKTEAERKALLDQKAAKLAKQEKEQKESQEKSEKESEVSKDQAAEKAEPEVK